VSNSQGIAGRALNKSEIAALMRILKADVTTGARDAAMLAILLGSGLRRTEVVSLELSDFGSTLVQLRCGGGGGKTGRWPTQWWNSSVSLAEVKSESWSAVVSSQQGSSGYATTLD